MKMRMKHRGKTETECVRETVSGVEMRRDAEKKIMILKPWRGVSSALPSPQLTRLRLQRVTRNSREGDKREAGQGTV
jgi:hypothetical protein